MFRAPTESCPYAELHCLSNFSFLRGASHPAELVERAGQLGYHALSITDRNSLAGIVRAHVATRQYNEAHPDRPLRLIIGAEITPLGAPPIVLLAPHRHAYARLARLLTRGKRRAPKGHCHLTLHDLADLGQDAGWIGIIIYRGEGTEARRERYEGTEARRHQGTKGEARRHEGGGTKAVGVVTLAKGRAGVSPADQNRTPHPQSHDREGAGYDAQSESQQTNAASFPNAVSTPSPSQHSFLSLDRDGTGVAVSTSVPSCLRAFVPLFPANNLYLALELHHQTPDAQHMLLMAKLSERTGIPLVACNDVHYHIPQRRFLQNILTCIREGCTIDNAGRRLLPNAERHLRPREHILCRYTHFTDPHLAALGRAAIARTITIARRCTFTLDELRYNYPHEVVPEGYSAMEYLERETWAGAMNTYIRRHGGTEARRHEGEEGTEAGVSPADRVGPASRRPIRAATVRERTEQCDIDERKCSPHATAPRRPLPHGRGADLVSPHSANLPTILPPTSAPFSPSCLGASVPACLPPAITRLLRAELSLIRRLRYEHYFLTVHDIVRFARSRGILCQGRGSAANSAVCYCLGITAVDPTRHDLLFERFISAERNEPPDIDVDFEHEHREEVFQYIYEKYGRERAALTAEVIRYRRRSAVRDVGKALGLPLASVDKLAKSLDWFDTEPLAKQRLRAAGIDPHDRRVRMLVRLVQQIIGFPRHLSQHVGGFVITETPLCEIVPLQNSPMPGRTFIEWDKDDIDALGILKIDCLALGMLTAIQKCFGLLHRGQADARNTNNVRARRPYHPGAGLDAAAGGPPCSPLPVPCSPLPAPHSLRDIPPEDPAVYEMISAADTIGVFQIESRAQMSMLPRLRPRNFYDLVIQVAIVRPGPIQGGMVHPYLRRRDGLEPVAYPSDAVRKVLHKTLGVPLFQEQVMRLAVVAAGFTPGQADQLRRAMGAWRRNGTIGEFETQLIEGMRQRGYSQEFAEQIFKQICGFGEYGFPESHAASFALLVYASAWLKRYHPAAFCAAMLNSQPLGFYSPGQLIRDAIAHGVPVRPVDVLASDWDCKLEEGSREQGTGSEDTSARRWGVGGPAVRLGFRLVRGLSEQKVRPLVGLRRQQRITSVDMLARNGVSRETLLRLAAVGAFASLGLARREAVWRILALDETYRQNRRDRANPSSSTTIGEPVRIPTSLFAELEPDEPRPTLRPMSLAQTVVQDYESQGFSLEAHPMSLVRGELDAVGQAVSRGRLRCGAWPRIVRARELRAARDGRRLAVAGLVTCRQRPATASGIVFMTLEDETGMANLVIRQAVYQRDRSAARGTVALTALGRVQRSGQVVNVMVERMVDLSSLLGSLRHRSRDFH